MARWDPSDLPPAIGRRVLITGANTGIGFEAARWFVHSGAEVLLGARDEGKGEAAIQRLRAEDPKGTVSLQHLDLGNLDRVRDAARHIVGAHDRLDRLILNAGVMIPPLGRTAQGFEEQFGVNHLGHFALTCLLHPLLSRTPGSRVTAVTSVAGDMGRMWWEDLNWEQRRYRAWQAYGQSKLANQLFIRGLARRVPYDATLAHPGWSRTDLQRHSLGAGLGNLMLRPFNMSAERGALTTVRAAMEAVVEPAAYFGARGLTQLAGPPKLRMHAVRARRDEDVERLWKVSEDLTGCELVD